MGGVYSLENSEKQSLGHPVGSGSGNHGPRCPFLCPFGICSAPRSRPPSPRLHSHNSPPHIPLPYEKYAPYNAIFPLSFIQPTTFVSVSTGQWNVQRKSHCALQTIHSSTHSCFRVDSLGLIPFPHSSTRSKPHCQSARHPWLQLESIPHLLCPSSSKRK